MENKSCQRCQGNDDQYGFIDYHLSPAILSSFLHTTNDRLIDPRSLEDKCKLRQCVGLPGTPINNYDMKEMIKKLNDIKNYNIGNIKLFTKAYAFTESVTYHIIKEKMNSNSGYIFFTQQAEEFARWKGTLYLYHEFDPSNIDLVLNVFNEIFGDRFHWHDSNSTIAIHLLPK